MPPAEDPPHELARPFFTADPLTCARELLGCELVWGGCTGVIVETEAYFEFGDEAAHTFFRRGARTFVQEKPPGALYIYLNYGVHWMLNFLVKGGAANGFVLIRALQPLLGLEKMMQRRGQPVVERLCSGPGKLTQALGIDRTQHGQDFFDLSECALWAARKPVVLEVDRRIGITKAVDAPWRFLVADSRFVSFRKKNRPAPG